MEPEIPSPFAKSSVLISPETTARKSRLGWWLGGGTLLILLVGIGIFAATRFVNDPYRTLESFPTDKYFQNYRSVVGAKFKATLKVEADLGWKQNKGRLMVFTEESGSRPIVILFPSKLGNTVFNKGQSYLIEMDVLEGGLIYARSAKKL